MPGRRPIGAVSLAWPDDAGLDDAAMAHLRDLVDAGAQALGRARLEDAERRSRSLLRAIVDQIPLGILILEPDGTRPLYTNRSSASCSRSTTRRRPASPRPCSGRRHALPEADRPLLRATLHGEIGERRAGRPPVAGRRARSVLVNAWPVRDGDGTILAGVATHVDVTSRLEADGARDAFLGVLSHELRTPITSIYAGAELLAAARERRPGHPRPGGRASPTRRTGSTGSSRTCSSCPASSAAPTSAATTRSCSTTSPGA